VLPFRLSFYSRVHLFPTPHIRLFLHLNPPEESSTIDKATDVEIFQAVMDAKEDSEQQNGDHGDDKDTHDNAPHRPTRNEALRVMVRTRWTI
jgi:hypothetical protein